MRIWIIDHYSVPVKYYPLARNANFAKELMKMGHEVIIFAASTVHNSSINLIDDKREYIDTIEDGLRYVLIKCHHYTGNGLRRILNMSEFARKLEFVCDKYINPDAIISTSMTLFACKKGIKLSKKYGCRKIAQITDLWPETLIAYGFASKYHPIVLWFRRIEKWIYKNADTIIFSMEGAYDYIIEQGWEKEIPRTKVKFINNGVDLEWFDQCCEKYTLEDEDLNSSEISKVIYTGSIRQVNNLNKLLDVACHLRNPKIKILIWGEGDQKEILEKRLIEEKITNVVFKGRVDKKYIPYITSKADINIAHNEASPLFRFGISFNKIFDYLAAGKPIICDFPCRYNPVIMKHAGIAVNSGNVLDIAKTIEKVVNGKDISELSINARNAAIEYSFANLAKKLFSIIEGKA